MLLETALSQFLTARKAEGRSPRTLEFYEENIKNFIDYISAGGMHGSVWARATVIEEYLSHERARGLSERTVLTRYQALRALFNWLKRRGLVDSSPVDLVQEPAYRRTQPLKIGVEQYFKLKEAIPDGPLANWTDHRNRLIVSLLFWTGLRIGELLALQLSDIDGPARLIKVAVGKGKKGRLVPFPHEINIIIERYLETRPPWSHPEDLILSNNGYGASRGRLGPAGVRVMLKRRCRSAALPYFNPHSFRHGFAVAMLNSGGLEMGILSKLLGHASVKMTQQIYADWETAALHRAYDLAEAAISPDLDISD